MRRRNWILGSDTARSMRGVRNRAIVESISGARMGSGHKKNTCLRASRGQVSG